MLIGACLAPFNPDRLELLEKSASCISDWEHVLALCGARYVTPSVYNQLRLAKLDARIPEQTRQKFKRLYLSTAALNSLRIHQIQKVNDHLADMGVDALIYKGASLVMGMNYPDPGQRMFSDIDLLVSENKKNEVDNAFSKAGGWRKLPPILDRPWEDTKYMDDWDNVIEVHWQLKPLNGISHRISEKRLLKNTVKIKYKDHDAIIPSIEDRYIQSAVHSTANHPFDSTFLFMMVSDLAHIASDKKLDWKLIVEELKKEQMHEHGMIATSLTYELTKYKPLLEGMEVFRKSIPGIDLVTADFTNALLKMMMKPWVFSSKWETIFFVKKSILKQIGFSVNYLKMKTMSSKTRKHIKPIKATEEIGISSIARYKRDFLDPDFLKYLLELYRFYHKINYKSHDVINNRLAR